jgi:3,4-dihydroxy-2-butanone 4-phosphate synthase
MIKKIKNKISSLIKSKKMIKTDKDLISEIQENTDLLIDIDWDDIANGISASERNSIIANCFRKYGMEGSSTPCKMVLDDGQVFVPEQLSDHWLAWLASPKMKPKTIKYINITNT